MRARLPLRLARSAVFTVVCVALAVLGHRVAGGTGPEWWAVGAGGGAVTVLTTLVAGRERSPLTITLFLVGTQAGLHQLLGASAGGSALNLHLAHGDGLGADIGMLVAHLTATLITGWWLARGESALWSVLRRVGALAVHGLRRVLALLSGGPAGGPYGRAPRPPRHLRPLPARRELRDSVRRRGPPLPFAC
ncbi:MFS transporter [Sphaerisporangium aureirubrum]|uniref:MFS transporter n=1 Tax=Sphaerisporangium aureirubrum TaxID=1544736 RepID=A0ABW1NW34_9ACTN